MSATVTWSNPLNTIYNITNYNLLLGLKNSHDYDDIFYFNQTSVDLRSVILKPLSITSEYNFIVSQSLLHFEVHCMQMCEIHALIMIVPKHTLTFYCLA